MKKSGNWKIESVVAIDKELLNTCVILTQVGLYTNKLRVFVIK